MHSRWGLRLSLFPSFWRRPSPPRYCRPRQRFAVHSWRLWNMNRLVTSPRSLTVAALLALPAFAQDARQIMEESQRRGRANSQRYEGFLEVIGPDSKVTKKAWQFIRIGSYGNSKGVIRFTAPAEVKGVALLIVNHPDRASDQWMWTPAIGRDRRIALQDRSTRFFGTDFSFEDLEERDVNQYDYKLLGEEDGSWKIEARPKESKSSQYEYSRI